MWVFIFQECEYKNGYSKQHLTIKMFWKVLYSLDLEDKQKFLGKL